MDDKTQALAQELVDYISGEPKRFEEEQTAKVKSQSASAANRKARLVAEVASKISAAIPRDEDAAPPSSPSSHK